jgi:hypothetical protein
MSISLGVCNSESGTPAREFTLRYSVRPHPDANVLRRLQCGTGRNQIPIPTSATHPH